MAPATSVTQLHQVRFTFSLVVTLAISSFVPVHWDKQRTSRDVLRLPVRANFTPNQLTRKKRKREREREVGAQKRDFFGLRWKFYAFSFFFLQLGKKNFFLLRLAFFKDRVAATSLSEFFLSLFSLNLLLFWLLLKLCQFVTDWAAKTNFNARWKNIQTCCPRIYTHLVFSLSLSIDRVE